MAGPDKELEQAGGFEFSPDNFLNSLIWVSKTVLLAPRFFFEGMKRDGGLRNPFFYLLSCAAVHSVLAGLLLGKGSVVILKLLLGAFFPFLIFYY